MGKFDTFAQTALSLISQYGVLGTITGPTPEYDPITQQPGGVPPKASAWMISKPPGKSAEFRIGSLEGRSIREFVIAMKGVALIPAPGNTITAGGKTWKIIWSDVVDPAADGAIVATCYGQV